MPFEVMRWPRARKKAVSSRLCRRDQDERWLEVETTANTATRNNATAIQPIERPRPVASLHDKITPES